MTKVKICGLTNIEDVHVAVNAGADYLGFIFYEKSPRFAKPEFVAKAVREIPEHIKTVGVFVNSPKCLMTIYRKELKLDIIQLHGDEQEAVVKYLEGEIWKAFPVRNHDDVVTASGFVADRVVIDSRTDDYYGGTGEVCDWLLAEKVARKREIVLAGGLNPDNIVDAIVKVKPYGVDVCSGVEKSPGEKNHRAIYQLIENVRSVNL